MKIKIKPNIVKRPVPYKNKNDDLDSCDLCKKKIEFNNLKQCECGTYFCNDCYCKECEVNEDCEKNCCETCSDNCLFCGQNHCMSCCIDCETCENTPCIKCAHTCEKCDKNCCDYCCDGMDSDGLLCTGCRGKN